MGNILLISQFMGYKYAPVGSLYVANALEKAGYSVSLTDSSKGTEEVLKIIDDIKPLFVGLSVFTTPTIQKMIEISKVIKQETAFPVVWGGVHPTILYSQCLQEDFIDYVIRGEGEELIVQLAKDLERRERLEWRSRSSAEFIKNLDVYEPSWHLIEGKDCLYDESHSVRSSINERKKESIFYYFVTSRGCPFKCAFCYNTVMHRSKWRGHSVNWVKKQIQYLIDNYNIDGIGFWDDNFLADKRRAMEIIEYLRANDIAFLCESRAATVDESLVRKLKECNCLQLFIGGESGSPKILKSIIQKIITLDDVLRAAELGNKYNLPIRISFMFGLPGETIEDMMMTKSLILRLLKYPNVSISGPKMYTPYPGTKLFNESVKRGFTPPLTTLGWKDIHRASSIEYLPWFKEELERNNISIEELFYEIKACTEEE